MKGRQLFLTFLVGTMTEKEWNTSSTTCNIIKTLICMWFSFSNRTGNVEEVKIPTKKDIVHHEWKEKDHIIWLLWLEYPGKGLIPRLCRKAWDIPQQPLVHIRNILDLQTLKNVSGPSEIFRFMPSVISVTPFALSISKLVWNIPSQFSTFNDKPWPPVTKER